MITKMKKEKEIENSQGKIEEKSNPIEDFSNKKENTRICIIKIWKIKINSEK